MNKKERKENHQNIWQNYEIMNCFKQFYDGDVEEYFILLK